MSEQRVSGHGGHSGDFCSHARDHLAEIVERYAELDFAWVGLTEHMPAARDEMVPSAERRAGLDAKAMYARFEAYVAEARALKRRFHPHLEVRVAFETDVYGDSLPFLRGLIERFEPDYVVGSVHHVRDRLIDDSPEVYAELRDEVGGAEALYAEYFDLQHDLVCAISPAIVGHFDLIRLLDPDYERHLALPRIRQRITRNLRAIRERGLALDHNFRALAKGQPEPYPSAPILAEARSLGIPLIPGDDSHGLTDVAANLPG